MKNALRFEILPSLFLAKTVCPARCGAARHVPHCSLRMEGTQLLVRMAPAPTLLLLRTRAPPSALPRLQRSQTARPSLFQGNACPPAVTEFPPLPKTELIAGLQARCNRPPTTSSQSSPWYPYLAKSDTEPTSSPTARPQERTAALNALAHLPAVAFVGLEAYPEPPRRMFDALVAQRLAEDPPGAAHQLREVSERAITLIGALNAAGGGGLRKFCALRRRAVGGPDRGEWGWSSCCGTCL